MQGLEQLIILAILVEAIWENGKMVWEDGKFSYDKLGALLIALMFAFALQADLLSLVGFTPRHSLPGIIGSAFIISRGGNIVHDLIDKINGYRRE